jgi:mannose-6-phosphate isomerase-like protein (cupin superfamily)
MRILSILALLAMASAPAFAQGTPAGGPPNTQANLRATAPVAPMDHVMVVPAEDLDKVVTTKRIFDGGGFSANELNRKPGDAESALMHKFTSEVYVIQSGSATLMSGGHLIEPLTGPPDQRAGKGIEGGTTQQVKAGDVVFIPAGVPHVFSAYSPNIKYLNIRFQDPKYVGQ